MEVHVCRTVLATGGGEQGPKETESCPVECPGSVLATGQEHHQCVTNSSVDSQRIKLAMDKQLLTVLSSKKTGTKTHNEQRSKPVLKTPTHDDTSFHKDCDHFVFRSESDGVFCFSDNCLCQPISRQQQNKQFIILIININITIYQPIDFVMFCFTRELLGRPHSQKR